MKWIFSCFCPLLLCTNVFATHLQPSIDHMINQVDPKINMGIVVIDLNTGERLYERNASQLFIPASNMKLFSNAAALLAFGPGYRFSTSLSTDAKTLQDGVLKGSLYLYMVGDPSFTSAHIKNMLFALKDKGITEIQGDIVLVSNHQNISPYAPGVVKKDATFSYGASVAPMILDENRIIVTVNPAYRAHDPAIVELQTNTQSPQIHNMVTTADKPKGCGIDFNMEPGNQLNVRGCIGLHQPAFQQGLAVRAPLHYTQEQIKWILSNMHIMLNGQVITGHMPKKSFLLATHKSKPLEQLMADTLKPSDNLYADALFLQTAAKLHGEMLNWTEAQPVIKQFLGQQMNIQMNNAVLIDGSGLSRMDRVTPEQTVQLLHYLHARFAMSYEYISALPIAGQDGTLQRRFTLPLQRGLIRAKTGTMTGVIGLSGYIYAANGHTLAFSIYVNTLKGTAPKISGQYRHLVDSICAFLLKQRPDDRRVSATGIMSKHIAFMQNETPAQHLRQTRRAWRNLEYSLKHALQQHAISVLYRAHQLVLIDHTPNPDIVWAALQTIYAKHKFLVELNAASSPLNTQHGPYLLWSKHMQTSNDRTWTLQPYE